MALSSDEIDYIKISERIHKCKNKTIAWWIKKDDYLNNKVDPLGKEIKNSCNVPFCPKCRKRVAYKKALDVYTKIEYYDYIYHWTFSPHMDLWDSVNYKDVRTKIFKALKDYFVKDYGVVFGVHYIGDKKDNYQFRLHFHLLIFSKKKYPLKAFDYGITEVQDTKSVIIQDIKESLGITPSEYVHTHVTSVKDRKSKFNLFEAVKYLVKYIGFGKKDFDEELLDDYCRYYSKYKMNMISYSGDFRKGRKLIVRRDLPKPKQKYYRGFLMMCKSVFWLKEKDIVPIDIDYYYDEYLPSLRTVTTEFLERKKGVG